MIALTLWVALMLTQALSGGCLPLSSLRPAATIPPFTMTVPVNLLIWEF